MADRAEINTGGTDLSFITVKITDKDGNLCPEASNLVKFKIEGEGTLLSVGNGDPHLLRVIKAISVLLFMDSVCLL